MYQIPEHLKEESKIIKNEFRERMFGFIAGAFGLVAGLAWNDAIKTLIDHVFPIGKESIWAKFIYAGLVSVVVILLLIGLARLFKTGGK